MPISNNSFAMSEALPLGDFVAAAARTAVAAQEKYDRCWEATGLERARCAAAAGVEPAAVPGLAAALLPPRLFVEYMTIEARAVVARSRTRAAGVRISPLNAGLSVSHRISVEHATTLTVEVTRTPVPQSPQEEPDAR